MHKDKFIHKGDRKKIEKETGLTMDKLLEGIGQKIHR